MAMIVLNAAAQGQTISMLSSGAKDAGAAHEGKPDSLVISSKSSAPAVAAPNYTRYTGLIPADASVVEWCIRVYRGT